MYRNRLAFVLAMVGLAAILVPSSLPAQITFQRTYGGALDDIGYSVQQTTDGGYIVAGSTYSFGAGERDVYLVKADADGDTLWTRTYGGPGLERGNSVRQTADGGFAIIGSTNSLGAGGSDFYLIKTNANGDTMWTRTYGGPNHDYGRSVQQTSDGGYVIAGYTSSFGAGAQDVYLVKADARGDTLWTRTYGGPYGDYGYSVKQTPDGGHIVAGYTCSFGAGAQDIYLVKTSPGGDTLWTRTFGGAGDDYGTDVEKTTDGGYVIAGATYSFGAGRHDVYLVRTDANGDTLWTRTYGGADDDYGSSVQQTAAGGYIIAGRTSSFGAGGDDAYLIKTDADGGILWTRTFGGGLDDRVYPVQQTADGGLVVTGRSYSFGEGEWDVYLIKTDSLGNVGIAEPQTPPTRASALSLTCNPNPFSGITSISLKPQASSPKLQTLRVYDASGRLVHSVLGIRAGAGGTASRASFPLDLRALPSGVYVAVLGAGGQHASARIVLQR